MVTAGVCSVCARARKANNMKAERGRTRECPWQEPSLLHPEGDRPCWADAADADEMHDECRTRGNAEDGSRG